jgi:hypothetical protein
VTRNPVRTSRMAMARKLCVLVASLVMAPAPPLPSRTRPNRCASRSRAASPLGGTVVTTPGTFDPARPGPAGQTFRGDHAYVFYQKPVNPRPLPLVMWHRAAQFSKTRETMADGREGFQTLFLRRGFPVYLIHQPRRGGAGRSTVGTTITPTANEQFWFNIFRIGEWPNYFPGVQFAPDAETLNQFFRSTTPNTGPFHSEVVSDATLALFDGIGPGGYEVPVHADIPHQEVIFLDEADDKSSPMKVKGVAELGICGVGAAVANAIYNATGIRVRDYPITLDKLLDRLPDAA